MAAATPEAMPILQDRSDVHQAVDVQEARAAPRTGWEAHPSAEVQPEASTDWSAKHAWLMPWLQDAGAHLDTRHLLKFVHCQIVRRPDKIILVNEYVFA